MKLKLIIIVFFISLLWSCQETKIYNLAITNVNIFDSETKEILYNKTILINADTIAGIIDGNECVNAEILLEGNNRIACPGFIDTHVHLADITGDYDKAPEKLLEDSIPIYIDRIRHDYLHYGVTTIRDAGTFEEWIDKVIKWQNKPPTDFPNYFICGGALISDEERKPYRGHIEVMDSAEASQKVQEYYDIGIRYVKLYWRLREPEMRGAVKKAQSLGMNIFGHIDMNIVSIQTTMSLGVRHFEHSHTPFTSVYNGDKHWEDFKIKYFNHFDNYSWWTAMLEVIRYVDSVPELRSQLLELYDEMAANNATLCSTTHLFGSIVNRTTHTTLMQTKTGQEERFDILTEQQLNRLEEDFDIFMKFNKIAHEKGVKLRIGTDCMQGGKALLSELLLYYEAGFSMNDILQIATFNGADAIDQGDQFGSIKVGKIADIVLFDKNPFDDYRNLLSKKTIIKSGKIYH